MLITNKFRSLEKDDNKTESARRIRHLQIESDEVTAARRKRHDRTLCPVCGAQIQKTGRGGRLKYCCTGCGATRNKVLVCAFCNTNRVWQGKGGAACVDCGKKHQIL
jgi:hypothetical protein